MREATCELLPPPRGPRPHVDMAVLSDAEIGLLARAKTIMMEFDALLHEAGGTMRPEPLATVALGRAADHAMQAMDWLKLHVTA